MAAPTRKWILLVGGLIACVLMALAAFNLAKPESTPLPNPNGYDDLVRAAGMIPTDMPEIMPLNGEELRNVVVTNEEALKVARTGLGRDCRVVLPSSPSGLAQHLEQIGSLKRLARAFIAEAKLAEVQNRPGQAAVTYVEVIKLGQQVARGGVIIDALVGLAVENLATGRLQKLAPQLNADGCKLVAGKLEAIEAGRPRATETLADEAAYIRRVHGFTGQIVRLATAQSIRKMEQSFVSKVQVQAGRNRDLLIELASRAYELDNGKRAQNIAALVPSYLKEVPVDPVTGSKLSLPR